MIQKLQGFGYEVKKRLMVGSFVLSSGYYDAYYIKAQKVRSLIKAEFDKIFENSDLILAPVAPTTAPKFGLIFKCFGDVFGGFIYNWCKFSRSSSY